MLSSDRCHADRSAVVFTEVRSSNRLSTFALACLSLASVTAAAADSTLDGSRSVCTHVDAALPRVIQVLYEDPQKPIPCKVLYEKDGSVEEIAAAKNSTGHCEKIERKVVRNLARGGYDCQHTFMGALASADRSVTLDLFSIDVDHTPLMRDVGVELPNPASMVHAHTRTHTHPIGDESGSAIEHTHTTLPEPDAIEPIDETTPPSIAGIDPVDATRRLPTSAVSHQGASNETPEQYAVLSRALPSQSEAHRFAAEFRRTFPKVETRVVQRTDANDSWHLALGVGDDTARLEDALTPLGDGARALFEIIPLTAAVSNRTESLRFMSDDWARYAIASCYADGQRTSTELADCASVVVDADAFVDCLGGGLCAPERFSEGMNLGAIDLAFVLSADDPVAVARQTVLRRVENCEHLNAADDSEFAECAALAIIDDDHRAVYDCYQRTASELAMLECAGSDTVADYARAYDRCGSSGYETTACILENSDNDFLESAAYCLDYEDAADIATCSLDANLSDDSALMLACVTDHTERTERATCLARERLSDSEFAAVQCSGYAESLTDYGLCVGERSGAMSSEALHAARCLEGSEVTANTLLDCAGGQFAGEDIQRCLEFGLEDTRCFDPETLISQVADGAIEDLFQLASLDNQITRFRQELYAFDGGDLAEVLATDGGASFKAVQEKTTGRLRGLLSFGKKK